MSDLFREEVLQAQRPQCQGAIRLATPVSHQIWAVTAAVFIVCIALFLCLGHYTRREHVAGSLVPLAGLLNVNARSAGTISELAVRAGTPVRAGEPLLTISGDQSSAALGDTDAAIAEALQEQQTQVRATLVSLPAQTAYQAKDLHRRIAMLGSQVREVDAQLTMQRSEATMADTLARKLAPLLKHGYVSVLMVDQYRVNALNAQSEIKELERQQSDTEQQRSQLVAQLKQLPLTTAATEHQLRGQLAQLATSVAQNDVARNTVLRAARAGVVASVLVKPGQSVTAGQALLSILPKGSPLEAQLLVPSSAIGFVHEGTPVVLHYQAFPYQKFGVQRGTVAEVSRTALTPVEVASLLGQAIPATPLYLVDVKLAAQGIEAYGKRQTLLPGMTLDADLQLDRRSIIQWIFAPLYGIARGNGGRA